ncbi:hypothetical protein [Leptospira weilii]|uniref:hypothetical protein n=1 Tax=Leptospira weilii TaxID=28184 RepID=UPI0007745FE8|nr:hypothetical protein [Leptospira weilii]
MIESITELLPTVLLNGLYMGLVLTVSQVLFRNLPHRILLKNKRLVVFIVATLIAVPYNIFYWITMPEVFTYCVSFDSVKEEICKILPGWTLAVYQSIRLFVCYLATILLYNKIVKSVFERSGFGHTPPPDALAKKDAVDID